MNIIASQFFIPKFGALLKIKFFSSWQLMISFFVNGHYRPLFLYFNHFYFQFTVKCWWVHSNLNPWESEANTLPTVPQPLPPHWLLLVIKYLKLVQYKRTRSHFARLWRVSNLAPLSYKVTCADHCAVPTHHCLHFKS